MKTDINTIRRFNKKAQNKMIATVKSIVTKFCRDKIKTKIKSIDCQIDEYAQFDISIGNISGLDPFYANNWSIELEDSIPYEVDYVEFYGNEIIITIYPKEEITLQIW